MAKKRAKGPREKASYSPIARAYAQQAKKRGSQSKELAEAREKVRELEARLAHLEESARAHNDLIRWLHRDGSLAQSPTLVRHMVESEEWQERLNAVPFASKAFEREVKKIAREAEVTVREVYTLFWSP